MFTLLCAISMQNLKFYCKDRRLLFYMSRTLHLFGTDWCAMMVPIQVIRWYRMQCYDGTDSCAIVVPIRRYCQPKGWKCRKNWLVVYIIMCLMIIFVRYLMSLTGAIKQESCRHHSRQDSLFKKRTYSPNSFSIFFMMSVLMVENSDLS